MALPPNVAVPQIRSEIEMSVRNEKRWVFGVVHGIHDEKESPLG
jgi:hypothetical protein